MRIPFHLPLSTSVISGIARVNIHHLVVATTVLETFYNGNSVKSLCTYTRTRLHVWKQRYAAMVDPTNEKKREREIEREEGKERGGGKKKKIFSFAARY